MAKTLPELLALYLERLELSNNSFAKKAGCVQSTVSKVRNGGSPPEGREEAWADVFRLKGDERAEFTGIYRGTKAKAQHRAQPHLEEQDRRIERLEKLGSETKLLLSALLPFLQEGKKLSKQQVQAIKALLDSI